MSVISKLKTKNLKLKIFINYFKILFLPYCQNATNNTYL